MKINHILRLLHRNISLASEEVLLMLMVQCCISTLHHLSIGTALLRGVGVRPILNTISLFYRHLTAALILSDVQ